MNLFGWDFSLSRKTATTISIDQLVRRLEAVYGTASGVAVTPENCMQSPTVHAIVTAICNGISACPVHIYLKTMSKGRTKKEHQPNHPVERLLAKPNDWQSANDYWLDATSTLVRYGKFFAYKARGDTGPIRRLIPIAPPLVEIKQATDYTVSYKVTEPYGKQTERLFREMHYARGAARDFLNGDSPVMDCAEAIGLEIAMQKFGGSFFGGGAMPGVIFKFMEGFAAFKTNEERQKFVAEFQESYGRSTGRFKAMFLPKGVEIGQAVGVENDKAQFTESRTYQRAVICGAFNVPVYLAGDTEHQTFNNQEQQSINKVQEVILPYVKIFESAMERDLLTAEDRSGGIIIRFNLDGLLRGDFATRQAGQKIQREAGVINANDWRENENMNPRTDPGGEIFWDTGPSGQGMNPKPPVKPNGGANADSERDTGN